MFKLKVFAHPLSKDSNNNETDSSSSYPEFSLSGMVRFWLLLVFEVPSLACSLVLLYYLLTDRNLRRPLHNHTIIALLLVGLGAQLIDVPFYMNFVRFNHILPSSPVTCVVWWFAATAISNITNLIMAWASIERHILVFHDRWLVTKKKRLLYHYLPLFTIVIYGFSFYIGILLGYSCENMYAFDYDWCSYPCYYNNEQLGLYDTIVNSIIPTPLIVFFSIGLLGRVLKQKQVLHRRFEWRKHRLMAIQLLSISAMFLLFNLPMTTLLLTNICGVPLDNSGQFSYYTYFLYHYVSLLMPFVCMLSLPDIRAKVRRQIGPQTLHHIARPFVTRAN